MLFMTNVMELVDRYVAVWNESNAEERRRRIRSVWAPDGTTCYRLLDAHGYEAIEERVAGSWDRSLRDGKYTFRPKPDFVCHHHVVRLNFEMVTIPDGETWRRAGSPSLFWIQTAASGTITNSTQPRTKLMN
ncbi:MAG: hypothetical protein ACLQDV_14280 [Candidatus Binataceae bacterium]